MTKEELNEIKKSIETSDRLLAELEVMSEHKQFLLKEYRENPGWFGEDGSIEDIIKTCFDYGWACRGDYEYKKSKNK